jgi:RNA polymerase sigma factor (sigma-70 family)
MEKEYCSMSEYVSLAKKTINKFAPQFYNGLNKEMLSNEDAVSDVATAIMYADWRYDPDRSGSSGLKKTLYSYRNQCAIWAIQTYITNKYKKPKKYENMSLNFTSSDDNDSISYHDTIADNRQPEPVDILIENEYNENIKYDLEVLLDSGIISDKQKQQLKMYYMEDMTLSQIGKVFGVSREAIRQNIKRAIENIRGI